MAGEETGFDNPYSVCGFLGGLVLALAIVPQLYKTCTTKSAYDLSYLWQAVFLTALITQLIYFYAYSLWPAFAPAAMEFLLMAALTVMKVYLDYFYKRRGQVQELEIPPTDEDKEGTPMPQGPADAQCLGAGEEEEKLNLEEGKLLTEGGTGKVSEGQEHSWKSVAPDGMGNGKVEDRTVTHVPLAAVESCEDQDGVLPGSQTPLPAAQP